MESCLDSGRTALLMNSEPAATSSRKLGCEAQTTGSFLLHRVQPTQYKLEIIEIPAKMIAIPLDTELELSLALELGYCDGGTELPSE